MINKRLTDSFAPVHFCVFWHRMLSFYQPYYAMVDEYYKQTEFSGSTMAYFPSRVVNEICKKSARLFAHTFVFGLAAMQFGCASIKSSSNEPNFPPEIQAAILKGIIESTNGKPYRLMERAKFNEMMDSLRDTKKEMAEFASRKIEDNEIPDLEKELAKRSEELQRYLRENSKAGLGETAPISNDWVDKIDYGTLVQVASLDDRDSGPCAITVVPGSEGMRILVFEGIDNPLQPTSFEATFFKQTLGIPALDKVLGQEILADLRAYIVWHEAAHIGDNRDLIEDIKKLGELRDHAPQVRSISLKKEIYADVESLEKYCKITGKKNFLLTMEHLRNLSVVIGDDSAHATGFELEALLKKIEGVKDVSPELTPEATYEALGKLKVSKNRIHIDQPFWRSDESVLEEYVKVRYTQLANLIQRTNLTSFQESQIDNRDVQEVLGKALEAWEFFEKKLQEKGERCPVPPPSHMAVGRKDVKGTSSSPASRVAAGPT